MNLGGSVKINQDDEKFTLAQVLPFFVSCLG